METLTDALSWLSGYASSLGVPLAAGTIVITGARIGPVSVRQQGYYTASAALGLVAMKVGGEA